MGWFRLAGCYAAGSGVEESLPKAIAAYKESAELDMVYAMFHYGKLAYEEKEWERYYWWSRALDLGFAYYEVLPALLGMIPSFERGKCGRILFTVAPALRGAVGHNVFSQHVVEQEQDRLQRFFALYDAARSRAKAAVDCWSVVARRCGVVKDVRVMIARQVWREAWKWAAVSPLSLSSQTLPTSS
jgi:TPR repeat protein